MKRTNDDDDDDDRHGGESNTDQSDDESTQITIPSSSNNHTNSFISNLQFFSSPFNLIQQQQLVQPGWDLSLLFSLINSSNRSSS